MRLHPLFLVSLVVLPAACNPPDSSSQDDDDAQQVTSSSSAAMASSSGTATSHGGSASTAAPPSSSGVATSSTSRASSTVPPSSSGATSATSSSAPRSSSAGNATSTQASSHAPASSSSTSYAPGTTLVTYLGNAGADRLKAVVRLSNGSFLLGGQAANLDWVPGDVPRAQLDATGLDSTSTGHVAFLLHVDANLASILHVVHFPADTVRDVRRIRTTEVPGQPTGDIFISGSRDVSDYNQDGYYLAKLNGNFVNGAPTGVVWAVNVVCKPRQAGGYSGESAFKVIQPWDVGPDGRVILGRGAEYDFGWAQMERLGVDGVPEVVEHWTAHWSANGEWDGTPASSHPNNTTDPVLRSGLVLKAGRRGSLRSATQADFDVLLSDGNGHDTRKGRYPDDYYFSGPCPLSGGSCPGGPGYTGYKTSDKPTQRLGGIVVDRRNGNFYFGYSTQSVLPGGNPDFEPAVVAMDAEGRLLWWNRLYEETSANSSPDQYVDGVAIDYANNELVVLARTHGNNTYNFWKGNDLAASPGAHGFQNQFTGSSGNIHISWLGKFSLGAGNVLHSSYVAEYANTTGGLGPEHPDPNLDGWPNPNGGWPNVNTTRCSPDLSVDNSGNVYVACTGRRTITTQHAHQKMVKFADGNSCWNSFLRVYTEDLSTLIYSTLVVGEWDPVTEAGGGNTEMVGVAPIPDGVVGVGFHTADDTGVAEGQPIPVIGVPAWGGAQPQGESGILVRLPFQP